MIFDVEQQLTLMRQEAIQGNLLPASTVIQYQGAVPGFALPFLTKEGDLYVREWTDTIARTPRSDASVEHEEVVVHG